MELQEEIIVNGNSYQLASFLDGGHKTQLFALIRDLLMVFGNQGDVPQAVFDAVFDAQTAEDQAQQALIAVQTAVSSAEGIIDDVSGAARSAADSATAATASKNASALSAGTALGYSASANTAADAARAAQILAELARDAAGVGGEPYPDEATGRAAVADGAVFKALSTGNSALTWYRRVSASASTPLASFPSTTAFAVVRDKQDRLLRTYATEALGRAAVQNDEVFWVQATSVDKPQRWRKMSSIESVNLGTLAVNTDVQKLFSDTTPLVQALQIVSGVHDDRGNKYPLALTDAVRILGGFTERGALLLRDTLISPDQGLDMDAVGRVMLRQLADGYQFGALKFQLSDTGIHVMDLYGRCALSITRTGRVIIPDLRTDTAQAATESGFSVPQACEFVRHFRRRDINHILLFGQSLSRGSTSLDPISTVQPYSNVTLKGGVLARPTDAQYDVSDFKPLVEHALASSGSNAESPTSGVCNGVVRRLVADGEAAAKWVYCGTSSGNGGTTVTTLRSNWLPGLKQVVSDTQALCNSKGLSYGVAAHVYVQGEAEYSASSSDGRLTAFDYDQSIGDLHEELARHIMQTTGQAWAPYLVTYQVGTHRRYGLDKMWVALQQWRSSRLHEWHLLAVPVYAMPVGSDNLHLTAEGYWLLGEYIARAIHWSQYRKQGKWRPLEPVDVAWSSTHIDVRFYVPCKPLVIDSALCATVAHAGFVIRDGADVVLDIISNVAVLSDDTVRITLSAPAPAAATLTHARGKPGDANLGGPVGGPRSNVRDSHGLYDTALSPLGNPFALHNPAVMFEFNRQRGF